MPLQITNEETPADVVQRTSRENIETNLRLAAEYPKLNVLRGARWTKEIRERIVFRGSGKKIVSSLSRLPVRV